MNIFLFTNRCIVSVYIKILGVHTKSAEAGDFSLSMTYTYIPVIFAWLLNGKVHSVIFSPFPQETWKINRERKEGE